MKYYIFILVLKHLKHSLYVEHWLESVIGQGSHGYPHKPRHSRQKKINHSKLDFRRLNSAHCQYTKWPDQQKESLYLWAHSQSWWRSSRSQWQICRSSTSRGNVGRNARIIRRGIPPASSSSFPLERRTNNCISCLIEPNTERKLFLSEQVRKV